MKWERAVQLSKVDVAFRVSDAAWPEPTRIVKRRAFVAYNSNTPGDAGEWSTCPFKNVYDHQDWRPHAPIDAVSALGSLDPERGAAPSSVSERTPSDLSAAPEPPTA